MQLLLLSFVSGILTVLTPCVLPLLPVIIGSASAQKTKIGPIVITASLAVSLVIFTLLLKATTVLIMVDPIVWKLLSGGIILVFGVITLFPQLWDRVSVNFGLSAKSEQLLSQSGEKHNLPGNILVGMSLGPVFTSCSPTYALVLASVIPESFAKGLTYLIAYSMGLSLVMLSVSFYGQRMVKNLKWAANPHGPFKKILGVIFIVLGMLIISGYDKKIETALLDTGYLDATVLEYKFLNNLK